MIHDVLLKRFAEQFESLKKVVVMARARSLSDPPDFLFYDEQNVFVKSFLVSACSILEAFLQDVAVAYLDTLQEKINSANLPYNFVSWIAENEKTKLEFKPFYAQKNKKDISSLMSPNFWKTVTTFQRLGIDLQNSDASNYKDFISTTVDKRNKIVYHNDDALDLSFDDIIRVIDTFKEYSECLFRVVRSDPHLTL